jgi:hypothetical protein
MWPGLVTIRHKIGFTFSPLPQWGGQGGSNLLGAKSALDLLPAKVSSRKSLPVAWALDKEKKRLNLNAN